MRLLLGFVAAVLLLSATAPGYDANWWYEKYQKLGDANPKWDSLVREGIDHWTKGSAAQDYVEKRFEFALSVEALERAYAAGCRCPIALFIDGASGGFPWVRLGESLALSEKRAELTFVRIPCAITLASHYVDSGRFKEAVSYFEMVFSLSSPDVEQGYMEDARAGLQEAREELAAQERGGRPAAPALPPSPTKEQARAHVRAILDLIAQRPRTGDSRLLAVLEQVGPDNLDTLLETWGTTGATGIQSFILDNYLTAAAEDLVRPEHKALLLKWLPLRQSLAEVMEREGWVQDMRPFLVARIAEHDGNTNLDLLQATAALRDPAVYSDLVWHFENNLNGAHLYGALKNLPGIQLKDAVLRAWAASKSSLLAPTAMDYGVTEALEFAVEQINSPEMSNHYMEIEVLRDAIQARTGQHGSDVEIRAWVRANKGKLVFDEERRVFLPRP